MKLSASGLLLCSFLAGCGGTPPFGGDATDDDTTTGGNTDGTGITREGVPPGTSSPSANTNIFRSEPTEASGGKLGDGTASGISYDGASDTFTVDGLAFDGNNAYRRGAPVSSLNNGTFAVYEAETQDTDPVSGAPINQLTHRAIYGVSKNRDASGVPTTQFAIVRTGSYVNYGFGGFIYQRDTTVTLPSSGQAIFNGRAAGIRDFEGAGGLEYSTANVELAIDFEDFNAQTNSRGDGIRATFRDRRIFDINGNDITSAVVDLINDKNEASLTGIPDARFKIGPGVLDENGDAVGIIDSSFVANDGTVKEYENGKYYAILSGSDLNEVVGVVVLENSSERDEVTARDTSGFIVYRDEGIATP